MNPSPDKHKLEQSKVLMGSIVGFTSFAIFELLLLESRSKTLTVALYWFVVCYPFLIAAFMHVATDDGYKYPLGRWTSIIVVLGPPIGLCIVMYHVSWELCALFVGCSLIALMHFSKPATQYTEEEQAEVQQQYPY